MTDIKKMAAVGEGTTGILGYLTWYSVSEVFVKRSILQEKLLEVGLELDWLPKESSVADAFRKATKQVERKRIPAPNGVYHNYLIRDVGSDKDRVQRNIVLEVVDSGGNKLDYKPEEGILILDKKTQKIATFQNTGTPTEIVEEAIILFEMFKTHHDARTIRSMVCRLIKSMAATPVRPSGGIYFVPYQYQKELTSMVSFLKALPGDSTEAYMVPMIDTTENRDMIRAKLLDHLKDTLKSLKEGLQNSGLDRGNANVLLDDAKRRLNDFKEYQKLLQDEMVDMEEIRSLIRSQMGKMLEKEF